MEQVDPEQIQRAGVGAGSARTRMPSHPSDA
jgi:hypothetical protein